MLLRRIPIITLFLVEKRGQNIVDTFGRSKIALPRPTEVFDLNWFQKQIFPPYCDELPINWIVNVKWISWSKWSSSLDVSQETNLISISTYPSVHTHFNRSAQNYSLAKSNQWITSATMPFPGTKMTKLRIWLTLNSSYAIGSPKLSTRQATLN